MNKIQQRINGMSDQVKAATVYTIASLLIKGFHIITTPIFTRIMPVDQIGVFSTYITWQGIFSDVATIGLSTGAINIAMKEYKDKRAQYIKSALCLVCIVTIALGILLYAAYPLLESIIGLPVSYVPIMALSTFFNAAGTFWIGWKRYEYKYKEVVAVTIGSSILSALLAALAVLYANGRGHADLAFVRLITTFAATLLFYIPICIYIYAQKGKLVNSSYWRFSLVVGTPLIVNMLAKSILGASDKVMINSMVGAKAVGLYSVLYTVSSLANIVWSAINASIIPYLFENMEKDAYKERIRNLSASVILLFAVASIILMLFAPEIILLISTEEYLQAIYVAPPVAAGIFFTAFYSLYGNIIMYYKKTNYIMYCTSAAAVFNLVTNYIFIRYFGYLAAAYTTLASYMLMAIIYTIVCAYKYGRGIFDDKKMWAIGLGVIVFSLVCNVIYANAICRYAVIALIIVATSINYKCIIGMFRIRK